MVDYEMLFIDLGFFVIIVVLLYRYIFNLLNCTTGLLPFYSSELIIIIIIIIALKQNIGI